MEQVSTWLGENANTLTICLAFALLCFVFAYPFVLFRPRKIQTGEGRMVNKEQWELSKKLRRQREKQLICDAVEDVLLSLLSKGEITSEGYRNWHTRFATYFNIEDFENQKILTLAELKDILKKRRNGGTYYDAYKPVVIPGPKPGEREITAQNSLHALILRLQPQS